MISHCVFQCRNFDQSCVAHHLMSVLVQRACPMSTGESSATWHLGGHPLRRTLLSVFHSCFLNSQMSTVFKSSLHGSIPPFPKLWHHGCCLGVVTIINVLSRKDSRRKVLKDLGLTEARQELPFRVGQVLERNGRNGNDKVMEKSHRKFPGPQGSQTESLPQINKN